MLGKEGESLLFLLVILMTCTNADYYSASLDLAYLLEMETFLVENLEDYIQAEQQRTLNLRNYTDFVRHDLDQAKGSPLTSLENPLNAWKTIKRMTQMRRSLEMGEYDNKNVEIYTETIESYESETGISKPEMSDLVGAARGIARLQKVYLLDTSDLSNGIIQGRKVSQEMTASDCYNLGIGLLDSTHAKTGITWLLEAHKKLEEESRAVMTNTVQQFPHLENDEIVDNLVQALMKNDNATLALQLIREQLSRNPQNQKALEYQSLAEAQMKKEALDKNLENNGNKTENTHHSSIDIYEKTCRGEVRQSPKEQRELRCRYAHNNVPFCLIAPFKVEELNLDPYVSVYYEAIYDSEIADILTSAEDKIERSKIGVSLNKRSKVSEFRTSKNTWLYLHQHNFLAPIKQRLVDITGLSLMSAEALQVANYGIGGHYGPHYDFFEDPNFTYEGRGNRILTALFYINDVELGGATAFPYLRLAVPPIKGSLLVWYNLHRSLEFDYRTKHAGCPVIKGFKWICNEWFHTMGQELLRPCGLERDGYLSENCRGSDKNTKYF